MKNERRMKLRSLHKILDTKVLDKGNKLKEPRSERA